MVRLRAVHLAIAAVALLTFGGSLARVVFASWYASECARIRGWFCNGGGSFTPAEVVGTGVAVVALLLGVDLLARRAIGRVPPRVADVGEVVVGLFLTVLGAWVLMRAIWYPPGARSCVDGVCLGFVDVPYLVLMFASGGLLIAGAVLVARDAVGR